MRKNHLLRWWCCHSLLNWIVAVTLSLLPKLSPSELEPWFALWSFFLLRLLYQSTMQPCMEYYCHFLTRARNCYLELLDKLQKQICRLLVLHFAASLEPLAHRRNCLFLSGLLCYMFIWTGSTVSTSLFYERGLLVYSDRLHDLILSPFIYFIRMSMSTVPFLAHIDSGI